MSTAPLDAALRRQLVDIDPQLAETAPQLPAVEVELPGSGLSVVRTVRELTEEVTRVAAVAAFAAIGLALLVAGDRGRVLRRVGWWAVATGGLWVVLAFGLPALAGALLPGGAAVAGALVEVVAEGMVAPGLVLAAAGAALLLGRLVVGPPAPRSAARARRPVGPRGGPGPTPVPAGRPTSGRSERPGPVPTKATRRFARPPRPFPTGATPRPGGGPDPVEVTRRLPVVPAAQAPSAGDPSPAAEPLPATAAERPSSARPRPGEDRGPFGHARPPDETAAHGQRWVEGVGYVGPEGGESERGPSARP